MVLLVTVIGVGYSVATVAGQRRSAPEPYHHHRGSPSQSIKQETFCKDHAGLTRSKSPTLRSSLCATVSWSWGKER